MMSEQPNVMTALGLERPVFSQMAGQAVFQVDVAQTQGILSYQWHMLQENRPAGLLPLSCYEEAGQVRLCWRVTALQPLAVMFAGRSWSVGEVIGLIRQLYQILVQMDVLLLDAERLLLDNRYILVDPGRMALHLAYCPLMEAVENPDAIRQLLLRWLTADCQLNGNDRMDRLSALLLMLRDPSFHWRRLSELFGGIGSGDGGNASCDLADTYDVAGLQTISSATPPASSQTASDTGSHAGTTIRNAYGVNSGDKTPGKPIASFTRKGSRTEEGAEPGWRPDLWRIIPVQLILVVSVVAVYSGGILTAYGPDGTMARAGMALLAVALEFWAFATGKQRPKPAPVGPVSAAPRPSNGLAAAQAPPCGTGVTRAAATPSFPSHEPDNTAWHTEFPSHEPDNTAWHTEFPSREPDVISQAAPIISQQEAWMEETCLLAGKAGPCLRYEPQDAPPQCITVSKTPFLIGRMRDQVDGWLAHPTVGKLHAEIRLEKGMHTLVDLNSRNGTRVNGRPLTPYEPCALHPNDQILISGETLVFLEQAQS